MSASIITSKTKNLQKVPWGNGCLAYSLLNTGGMAIKQETMPGGTEEVLHYHKHAQQYFYILNGVAVFEIDEVVYQLHPGEGIQVTPQQKHRIMNKQQHELEFLVCSQPSTENDRFNLI